MAARWARGSAARSAYAGPRGRGRRLAREEQVVEAGAELEKAGAARVEIPHRGGEVVDRVAVAFAAEAEPAILGVLVGVQAGGAVLV